jgi:hypothetical protein
MSDALKAAYRDIRTRHRQIPQATIAATPGRTPSCGTVTWVRDPLLLVGADLLTRQPEDVLGHLLHQAAHGIVAVPKLPDRLASLPERVSIPEAARALDVSQPTAYRLFPDPGSNGQRTVTAAQVQEAWMHRARRDLTASEGRYHSAEFRGAAQRLGLEVRKAGKAQGWPATIVPADLREQYAPALSRLAEAMQDWQPPQAPMRVVAKRKTHSGPVARCSCDPPRLIQVASTVADLGPILCTVCNRPFERR